MVSDALRERANELLDELCEAHPLGYRPNLVWKKLRVSAGMAYYRLNTIGLSTVLLTTPERLESTLRHEYAHLLAYVRHGAKGAGHGPAWRAAMRELGVEPTVRHDYPVERNRIKREIAYRCERCGVIFAKARRFPPGRNYVHVRCGGRLSYHAEFKPKAPHDANRAGLRFESGR